MGVTIHNQMSSNKDQVRALLKASTQAKRESAESAEKAAEHVYFLEQAALLCPENSKLQTQAEKAHAELAHADTPDGLLALDELRLNPPASSVAPPQPATTQNSTTTENSTNDQGDVQAARQADILKRLAQARAAKDNQGLVRGGADVIPLEREANDLPADGLLLLAERKDAGGQRGKGLFALRDVQQGEAVVRVRPGLSVIFDASTASVCGYCFSSGAEADLQPCGGCGAFALCGRCRGIERLNKWHEAECCAYKAAPDAAKQKDSSVLRMLLRYASLVNKTTVAAQTGCCGDWADQTMGKEPPLLLNELEGHMTTLPEQMLASLSQLTGLPVKAISRLIFQIRTNAAGIERGGRKVGCSLSAYMGFANHDCNPNMQAVVDADGFLTLVALNDIPVGDEACISYIDASMPVTQRRELLRDQYQFDCKCTRCLNQSASGNQSGGKKLSKADKKKEKKSKKKR